MSRVCEHLALERMVDGLLRADTWGRTGDLSRVVLDAGGVGGHAEDAGEVEVELHEEGVSGVAGGVP